MLKDPVKATLYCPHGDLCGERDFIIERKDILKTRGILEPIGWLVVTDELGTQERRSLLDGSGDRQKAAEGR